MNTPAIYDYIAPDYAPLTAEETAAMQVHWATEANDLMQRDGTDTKHAHPVRENPLLKAAIEEIRDGYVLRLRAKMSVPKGKSGYLIKIGKINDDMKAYTCMCDSRLQQPDYGFTSEQKSAILAQENTHNDGTTHEGLRSDNAMSLIGSVILRSINVAEKIFANIAKIDGSGMVPATYCREWRDLEAARQTPTVGNESKANQR